MHGSCTIKATSQEGALKLILLSLKLSPNRQRLQSNACWSSVCPLPTPRDRRTPLLTTWKSAASEVARRWIVFGMRWVVSKRLGARLAPKKALRLYDDDYSSH